MYSILIIDDETSNLKVLSSLLKGDYRVIAVKSGIQGLVKAKELLPDLILLDVMMPEMDGFEVIQQLKSDPLTEAIPVIFITGLNSSKDEETGLNLGAIDYIYKPFFPAVVQARVSSQIKILRQKRELEALSEALQAEVDAKANFLANMSHEIRTPLTTIIGYTESYLRGDFADDERHGAVEAVARSGKHLLSLINDILDFSKLEAGQLDIDIVSVNLPELLHQVYQMSAELAKSKPITLSFSLAQPIPRYIKTDPTRLNQILLNLLSNAIKFTAEGQVSLTVQPCEIEGRSLLRFDVKDSGIGIAQDKLNKLFGAFSQLDPSTTRKYGGTGLGLNITRSLCHKLSGTISVESELNEGSVFSAFIELQSETDSDWVAQYDFTRYQSMPSALSQITQDEITGHILLAEDHDENRKLFAMILRSLGLDVDTVANGIEAVEQALIADYDLILMDIQMPMMDGITAFETLQQAGCDTPVIALTANVMVHDVEKYLNIGFIDHCAKPLDRQDLINKVKRYVVLSDTQPEINQAAMAQLQQDFKAKCHEYAADLQQAYSKQNTERLKKFVHLIKGSAASLGYPELTEEATKLETPLLASSSINLADLDVQPLLNLLRELAANT
ncbi:response regulator [Saccharobesus litoralis]|nr:response regulator [Saccharobesus litoralis]